MEKINECSCTSAYYCPDENQVEPGYTCDNCIELEKEEYMRKKEYNTNTVEYIEFTMVDDDLPF
jgi:hypothetical protein